MKAQIIITLQKPGLHAWPGVKETLYAEESGYLQYVHRHMFHFKAWKSVSHDDRDIEIISLKNSIDKYLSEKYYHEKSGCLMFGAMSCEMLARELIETFDLHSCEVMEDGENGAVLTQNVDDRGFDTEITSSEDLHQITFVCGELCGGKSTWAQAYCDSMGQNFIHVEVSDIVKGLLSTNGSREQLQGHPELDDQIIDYIKKIELNQNQELVISGVRQMSILQAFPNQTMIWIDTPDSTRFNRFTSSSRVKDEIKTRVQFDIANSKDRDLGLLEVKKYIFTRQ